MLIAGSPEEGEALAQRRAALAAAGVDAALLTAAEAHQLEPALQLAAGASALLVPSDLQVSGMATAAALQRACEAHGGRFTPLFHEGVRQLEEEGASARWQVVQTEARR